MKLKFWTWLALILFTLVLSSPLLLNGIQPDGRYLVNGGHDAFWHLSLIKEITRQFPPKFPGAPEFALQNYHYLAHIIMAIIPKLTGISIPFLYFKIYNPLLIFGLVTIIFKLALLITKSQTKACIVTFITLYCGSAAFLLPFFTQTKNWFGNSFMLEQPYAELFNLNATLAYILIFACLFFIYLFQHSCRLSHLALATICVIALSGIKVFYALPLVAGLSLLIVFTSSLKNSQKIFFFTILMLFPILFIKLFSNSPVSLISNLNFSPKWLLQKMLEYSNRVYLPDLLLRQQYYQSVHNIPRLIQIEVEQLLLYFLGNFWLRILGLIVIFRNNLFNFGTRIFLISAIFISAILPLLFTTNPDFFNIVQFGQVSIIISSFLTGIFITLLPVKPILSLAMALILSLTFYHDFFFIHKYTDFYVDKNQMAAIGFIIKNSADTDLFLVNNGNQYEMIIPGLAGRRTYFNGLKQIQVLGYNFTNQQQMNDDFFASKMTMSQGLNFLTTKNIGYIFMLKDNLLLKHYSLDHNVVFDDQTYQVIRI